MKKKSDGFLSRLSYGATDIYGGGAFVVIGTFYTVFLTKSLGMNPALAGTIPLVGKIWDAVTDPIMGNITDRTTSRFGPKRFYILIGSVISAITFILMWVSFPMSSVWMQYVFYMLMYMLFSTGFTIVMVPYNALLPDMVDDYTTRSKFSGVRIICSTFGAILAGLIPTLIIRDNTNSASYLQVALLLGVMFALVNLLTFFGTWERQKPPIKIKISQSFVQSFTVYRSRTFRLFIGIFLCGQGAADFVSGMAVYYVDDVLNAYGGGRFTYLMAVLLVAQFIGTIIFNPIMARTSKKTPILIGFPIRIVATLAMLAFSYEGAPFAVILALSFVIGVGMAASSVSIFAILSDIPDVDELITSMNRAGTCSGMATFARKIVTGLSASIIGFLLAAVGYDGTIAQAGGRQSAFTQRGIALLYVFLPVILMVVTLIFTKRFPLNKPEFEIIKKEIARRRGEDTSKITPEEIKVCEKITGLPYDKLWNPENAFKLKT